MLKIAVIAIVVIIFGLIFFDVGLITSKFIKPNIPFLNSQNSQSLLSQKQATISGTIQINGPIPQGSSTSIGVREHGATTNFNIFASGLAATDDVTWKYTQGKEGTSYDFQAYLDLNGSKVATSDPLSITAPATEEVLTLNIETPTASPIPATISGTVYINGYIPQGATFDVMGRKYGSTGNFSEVVDNLPALIKRTVTYSNAIAGQKYEIKGQLFDQNGTVIGSSNSIVLSAPSDSAEMTINSTAQPPQGTVTQIQNNTGSPSPTSSTPPSSSSAISGSINFNGSAPSGSSIVILAKQPADTSYQVVVNGINPQNGSTWTWNGAISGITYNMVAVLKAPNTTTNSTYDAADSQTYTVAAPAQNQLFTINTGISMGQPTGSVSISCGTKTNNVWNGNTVNFSTVSGAQYYSFQVGSTSGGNDIANISQAAQSTPNQTINVNNLNDSVIYYAQYAVSSVTSPTPAQYSPYTSAYTLKCPN